MATGIGVRSPYFLDFSNSSMNSAKLNITINGTLEYSILKVASVDVLFEISELIKDFIDIQYDGTLSATPLADYGRSSVSISWSLYSSSDGTGVPLTSSGATIEAYNGYAYFSDSGTLGSYALPATGILLSHDTIWVPENTGGYFYYRSSSSTLRDEYSTTDDSESNAAGSITIKRFPCSKYDPIKLVFVNRFGMPQDLWFFAKSVESNTVSKEGYKSNNVQVDGTYSTYAHQKKNFHVNGVTRYTLNTGFISEDYNEFMRELLLSEQVWAHIDGEVRPVNVVNSDITYKTSLNDQMVDYSVEIEQANDLILSMR